MTRKMCCYLEVVILALASLSVAWAAPQQGSSGQQSLYKRLGGYDALAAVSDDFIGRLATDQQLSKFFVGLSADSQKRLRQHFVDFLCSATGGPCFYIGRDMKTSHTGLHITDADWDAAVKDLTATFDKFKVPEKERADVVSAISGLKGDIVGR